MLRAVTLARQWIEIKAALPADWTHLRLTLTTAGDRGAGIAAQYLGPLGPGRSGREFHVHVTRASHGTTTRTLARALNGIDDERVSATLELVGAEHAPTSSAAEEEAPAAEQWDALVALLPPDWSDVYGEVELVSSDHLDPAALALGPVNPTRFGDERVFRFRCARLFGYGAAPVMVRRSLERLDEQAIPATVRILSVLSDTKPVGTQGPVWYVGGKVV